jgi:simple sugar transport system ATP-binding protein
MAEMMVGTREIPSVEARRDRQAGEPSQVRLSIKGLAVDNDSGVPAVSDFGLEVRAGEIVGVAGVAGNGQRELVEALMGQREPTAGELRVGGQPYHARRSEMRRHRVFSLPEEPLRNACVGSLSVADNMALRKLRPSAAGCRELSAARRRACAVETAHR